MNKPLQKVAALLFLLCAPLLGFTSGLSQGAPLSGDQWHKIHDHVSLLDKVAYFPSLLPIIMKHREAIGLSAAQIKAFRIWREQNYLEMVDLMNEIIHSRIELSKASLNARMTNAQILSKQKEIFELQEKVLRIRLSCRQIVTTTFSVDQWSNLGFVLEEYPKLAGLLDL